MAVATKNAPPAIYGDPAAHREDAMINENHVSEILRTMPKRKGLHEGPGYGH
jgi:hypothetical protein